MRPQIFPLRSSSTWDAVPLAPRPMPRVPMSINTRRDIAAAATSVVLLALDRAQGQRQRPLDPTIPGSSFGLHWLRSVSAVYTFDRIDFLFRGQPVIQF
jgi:hypothetical protein